MVASHILTLRPSKPTSKSRTLPTAVSTSHSFTLRPYPARWPGVRVDYWIRKARHSSESLVPVPRSMLNIIADLILPCPQDTAEWFAQGYALRGTRLRRSSAMRAVTSTTVQASDTVIGTIHA